VSGRPQVSDPRGPGGWIRARVAALALGAAVLGVVLSAVAGATVVPVAGVAVAAEPDGIAWTTCPHDPAYRCGTLGVPVDYRRPARGSVRLAVIERPVPHSRGVVVFNPGGPGESGVLILPLLASLVPAAVRDSFTLVSFDERGTGSSAPLSCGPSAASASSAVAGTAVAIRVFAGLDRSCRATRPALFPTVTTTTSARDMDRLRVALHAGRINFYGQSYGTVLGSVYRQLFPDRVRSMVLDGAVDANLSLTTDATLEAPAIETALTHELTACTATPACPLGPDPISFYRDLQERLRRSPLPAPGDGDAVPVTEGDLATASLLYLSVPTLTPGYLQALASAAAGDGAPLRSVALGLETDLDGSSLVGPLWTITCNDAVAHPDGATTAALARTLARRYPLGGAQAVSNNLIGCPGWSGSGGPVAHLTPTRAPTALVIGNTYDPNTPYESARRLTATIGGRLVTYVGYGHTWLLNGSTNACMQRVVSRYLLRRAVPSRGTTCRA
jgi:pimeloyl-ACP methyl ester carboxylesterase